MGSLLGIWGRSPCLGLYRDYGREPSYLDLLLVFFLGFLIGSLQGLF